MIINLYLFEELQVLSLLEFTLPGVLAGRGEI
jgi:hypothetical protein